MKPAARTIVLGHATVNRVTHTWPVAIFGDERNAKNHGTFATMAARTGDKDLLLKFDVHAKLADDGKVVTTSWYTSHTVVYDPEVEIGEALPPG